MNPTAGRVTFRFMVGAGYSSNAAVSKSAMDSSKKAEAASSAAKDDWESQSRAANAHYQAAQAHRQAGNETKAADHDKKAKIHDEKAVAAQRDQGHAEMVGQDAEKLSKKAHLAAYGQDPKEPRTEKELHECAADMHDKASKAYDAAGMEREAHYHADMSKNHAEHA
jgi:hypothetical protein